MPLSDAFNDEKSKNGHRAVKVNDNVLRVSYDYGDNTTQTVYYDFLSQVVQIRETYGKSTRIVLFSEMNPEVLRLHRDHLIELKGKPLPFEPAEKSRKIPEKGLGL